MKESPKVPDFIFFRQSRMARSFVYRLIGIDVTKCEDWDDFLTCALDNRDSYGGEFNDGFVSNVEEAFAIASSGEQALICGILHAMDYDALSERLAATTGRTIFDIVAAADVVTRSLVAACIARIPPLTLTPAN